MDNPITDEQLAILGLTREQFGSLQQSKVDLTPFQRDEQGRYAWDRWQDLAITAGVQNELAQLGRAVMREAVQHDWPQKLKTECGWKDGGKKMLELSKKAPEKAQSRWEFLLDTDGNRGRLDHGTGRWTSFQD